MIKILAGAGTLVLSLAGTAMSQTDQDGTLYRLFIGDHQNGQITVVNASDPSHRWVFEADGQSKLYPVAKGAVVVAVQSDSNTVSFFDSGISFADHGDHSDIEVTDPAPIAATLSGPRPFHLVEHEGRIAINYDQGGYAEVLDSAALAKGEVAPKRFAQARAHHGFVTPFGKVWLSTVASDAETTGDTSVPRIGLQAFDESGSALGDVATCTGIHGEAFSGAYLVAGCQEGVLSVMASADGPQFNMLRYPAELPQDVTTGSVLGSTAIQMFLGNHGADGLVVIDPVAAPHFQRISLPFRRVDFVLDPAEPGTGYVLTEDGSLHRIDMLSARIAASAKVIAPYSMDGHWNDPRPRIAVAGDEILMTDPDAGLVRRISTDDLSEIATIPVEGIPYNIAVAGGSGIIH